MTHNLLARQLRKVTNSAGEIDQEAFIKLVGLAYEGYEQEQRLQDNASRLMSDELMELNAAIRKERDEIVIQAQRRFELAVEGTNDGIWDWNVESGALWFSLRCKSMLGFSAEQLQVGQISDWYNLINKEDAEEARKFIANQIEGHARYPLTLRFNHASGSVRHIMCRASAVQNSSCRVTRLVGVHTDITDLISAQEALQEANKKLAAEEVILKRTKGELELILSTMNEGIYRLDIEGKTIFANRAALEMTGYSNEEMMGVLQHVLIHHTRPDGNVYPRSECHIYEALTKGRTKTIDDEVFWHKKGHSFPIAYTSTPAKDDQGNITGAVVVFRDITIQKQRELELQKAKIAAESANAAKSDFLANMSHEIRTPMNGVLGMASLLTGTELNTEQRAWVEIINRSGQNLLTIINDILDFSKIEAGHMALEPIPFNLFSIVNEVTDLLSLNAQESGVELIVKLSANLPRYVIGDPTRLRQILLNLSVNALKFTEKGHVLITVDSKHEQKNWVRLYFEVEDTGIGIHPDKIEHIFGKFSQAEESTTRKFGGTGLGLTISKSLVEMMNGSIGVKSELGKGSTFYFDVMLGNAEQEEKLETSVPDCDLSGIRMLAVDDSPISRAILYQYLYAWHIRIDLCITLEEAITMLENAARAGDPYRFVLADYNLMGERSGKDLAELVKSSPSLKDTILFMITALPQAVTSGNLAEKGFSGFLIKPFYPDHLKAALQILWDAHRHGKMIPLITRDRIATLMQTGSRGDMVRHDMFPGARVLVVEDMRVNLMLITKILEKHGCNITSAINGKKAVQCLRDAHYDVIFMDCQMPEMDGFEATKIIRKEEAHAGRHTAIVALTADAMSGDREKCLQAGMDDYLNKPFKPQQITEMLRKWVHKNPYPRIEA